MTEYIAGARIKKSLKILIVDDLSIMRRILTETLQQLGFINIFEAADGQGALGELCAENFDLVISDWHMDPVDGLQLFHAIRANEKFQKIGFLLITAENNDAAIATVKAAGVINYLIKPFNAGDLKQKVAICLAAQT